MKRFIYTITTLLLSGCGSFEVQAPAQCTDAAVCDVCEDGADCDAAAAAQASLASGADGDDEQGATSVGTTVVIPAAFAANRDDPPPDRSADIDPVSSALGSFDPFELSLLAPVEIDLLLSLFIDDLVLDMLPPADLDNELSFLERLCRQGDTPEFRCRQRYGE